MMTRSMICLVLLVELLVLDLDIPLAGRLLLPVLLHPRLEGLARRRIAAGKRQRRNIGVGNIHLARLVGIDDATKGIGERVYGAPIEGGPDDRRTVPAVDSGL